MSRPFRWAIAYVECPLCVYSARSIRSRSRQTMTHARIACAVLFLVISHSAAISNDPVRSKLRTRVITVFPSFVQLFISFLMNETQTGRQWTGNLAIPADCSFPVADQRSSEARYRSPLDRVSLCNFTSSTPQSDGVYAWQKGLASQASWLGGPKVDASNSTEGSLFTRRLFTFVPTPRRKSYATR